MFGHQNQHQDEDHDIATASVAPDQSVGGSMPWQHPGTPMDNDSHSTPQADSQDNAAVSIDTATAPDIPAANDYQPAEQPAAEPETHVYAPDPPAPSDNSTDDDQDEHDKDDTDEQPKPAADEPGANDLIDIKRDALGKLTPLVGHLDQTPEEKFRTTMMMIQASDNQSLVQAAYDAAQQITDEKARAQALLDVINEINYFTQPKDKSD